MAGHYAVQEMSGHQMDPQELPTNSYRAVAD